MSNTTTIATTGVANGIFGLSTDGIMSFTSGIFVSAAVDSDNPDMDTKHMTDDGGHPVTLTGIFPTYQRFSVRVKNYDGSVDYGYAYPGEAGRGHWVSSEDGRTCTIYLPPLPRTDKNHAHTLVLTSKDGVLTFTSAPIVRILKRTYRSNLYSVRASFPPPRQVGPYSIDEEETP